MAEMAEDDKSIPAGAYELGQKAGRACPLLPAVPKMGIGGPEDVRFGFMTCVRDSCAFWVDSECAVISLARVATKLEAARLAAER